MECRIQNAECKIMNFTKAPSDEGAGTALAVTEGVKK